LNNPYASKQRKYLAVRQTRVRPGVPHNRVILREADVRHITAENPLGKLLVYEGLQFVAYPTPKVKALVSGGQVLDVTDKGNVDPDQIPADALASIIDDAGLVRALHAAGVSTVEELVDAWVATQCEDMPGIGTSRQARIRTILVREGLIADEPGE
jgi:hypothetical protein